MNRKYAPDGVQIEAHFVRLPKSISPEAQRFLESLIPAHGNVISGPAAFPPAEDLDAWDILKELTR